MNPFRAAGVLLAVVAAASCRGSPAPGGDHPVATQIRRRAEAAPLVCAHRGESYRYPENTIPAFEAAVRSGAELVELDVMESKDGVLFCMHDETLDRTTDSKDVLGREEVESTELTIAELKRLDAGKWFDEAFIGTRIPTLEEALAVLYPRAIPMIERKHGRAAAYVELLQRLDLVDRVIVIAFDWDWVREIRDLEPRLLVAATGMGWFQDEDWQGLADSRCQMVQWRLRNIRLEDVPRLRERGYLLSGWTVNGDAGFLGAGYLGIDVITTDVPDRLRDLIDRGIVRKR